MELLPLFAGHFLPTGSRTVALRGVPSSRSGCPCRSRVPLRLLSPPRLARLCIWPTATDCLHRVLRAACGLHVAGVSLDIEIELLPLIELLNGETSALRFARERTLPAGE